MAPLWKKSFRHPCLWNFETWIFFCVTYDCTSISFMLVSFNNFIRIQPFLITNIWIAIYCSPLAQLSLFAVNYFPNAPNFGTRYPLHTLLWVLVNSVVRYLSCILTKLRLSVCTVAFLTQLHHCACSAMNRHWCQSHTYSQKIIKN